MPDVRLIDANALLAECEKAYSFGDRRGQLAHCISAIKSAPTIDAQPVKHGEWIVPKNDDEQPYCSVCNWHAYGDLFTDYCPGCGAYMVGD